MKLEPRTLAIAEPIKVKDVVYWKDGGSVSLRLADRNHAEHEFMIHAWTEGATLDSVLLQDFRGMLFRLGGRVRSYFLGSRSEGSLPPDHGGPSDAAQK
jgi:hypothetical protein